MTEILDRPPEEPDGDDQAAKPDEPAEIVTVVDFLETPELDENDYEDAGGDDA